MASSEGGQGRGFLGALVGMLSTVCLIGACMIFLAYYHPWSILFPRQQTHRIVRELEALGDSALVSRDVPVAAILLYGDSVIGSGFNTVKAAGNAGGHAEINAISAALRRLGETEFAKLDRDSLVLVTTYEPCPMCRGAIVLYNIRRVDILKRKPPTTLVREDMRILRYYWQREISGPEALQDSLFQKHPDYRRP